MGLLFGSQVLEPGDGAHGGLLGELNILLELSHQGGGRDDLLGSLEMSQSSITSVGDGGMDAREAVGDGLERDLLLKLTDVLRMLGKEVGDASNWARRI